MAVPDDTTSVSKAAGRKRVVRDLLAGRDLEGLRAWVRQTRTPLRTLTALLYEPDRLMCLRAAEALGIAAGIIAGDNLERGRELIRRLMWMMNDESGAVCWYAPEGIAEVLVNLPPLIDEYGPLLLAYLDEEPFERGIHWAVARVASVRPDIYEDDVEKLARSLDSPDPDIKGYTLMALHAINPESARRYIRRLNKEPFTFTVYDHADGTLREVATYDVIRNLL